LRIKFLGTAGARFVVARQIRASGGIFLEEGKTRIIIDPGPGSIVRMARSRPKIDPEKLSAIILTHLHIDHSNDVNIVADAMTAGGFKKRGTLFAPEDALYSEDRVVFRHTLDILESVVTLEEKKQYRAGDITFETSRRHDHDVETYGIKFHLHGEKLGLISDTYPFPGIEVRVKDPEGRDLPAGETGELHFRGECVVEGYFRMPEETAAAFDAEGWVASGDMGYVDEEGYIVLMGRKKEMYIQGGFNVYPVEVENLLNKHPKVSMAAGIGVPDPVMGEVGRYYIILKPGESATEDEIKAYCAEHLADYKVPKQIVFRDSLPLTPVGKVMKARLREDFLRSGE